MLLRVLNGFLDLGCLQLTQTVCINAERVLASCTILAHLSAEPLSMQPVTIAWRTVVAHSKLNLQPHAGHLGPRAPASVL